MIALIAPFVVFSWFCIMFSPTNGQSDRPHIIFIIADDLGWNDVGFNGMNEIPTPNIDALAYSGVILNNYYVTPICTPSRSSLMTGKYPIHLGMQHGVLYGAEPRGLPLTEKLLPQYLQDLGYTNHIVGKWHLGSYKEEYTPLRRGFTSHLGYWTGHQDYYDHTAVENPSWGLDMRRNFDVAYDLHGRYSTDVFTEAACDVIDRHDSGTPLFLYLAHAAVHSGNPYEPLRAPDAKIAEFDHIDQFERRKFAGMLTSLDESVGSVVKSLWQRRMLNNSIVIFTTDNGGAAGGFNLNAASNYPLRGVKNTLWEGGVRGSALLWSPLLEKAGRVAKQLMHISDWLPTLLSAVGSNEWKLDKIDGFDLWPALSNDLQSPRSHILHNIDDIFGNSALLSPPWKLLKGTTYKGAWDGWYGPSGRNYSYNLTRITNSDVGKALESIDLPLKPDEILKLRLKAEVSCTYSPKVTCTPLEAPCLFNIDEDPCELNNLAAKFPHVLSTLEGLLDDYNRTALPPGNLPLDPLGDPRLWNHLWTNFGDFINLTTAVQQSI